MSTTTRKSWRTRPPWKPWGWIMHYCMNFMYTPRLLNTYFHIGLPQKNYHFAGVDSKFRVFRIDKCIGGGGRLNFSATLNANIKHLLWLLKTQQKIYLFNEWVSIFFGKTCFLRKKLLLVVRTIYCLGLNKRSYKINKIFSTHKRNRYSTEAFCIPSYFTWLKSLRKTLKWEMWASFCSNPSEGFATRMWSNI